MANHHKSFEVAFHLWSVGRLCRIVIAHFVAVGFDSEVRPKCLIPLARVAGTWRIARGLLGRLVGGKINFSTVENEPAQEIPASVRVRICAAAGWGELVCGSVDVVSGHPFKLGAE